MSPESAAVHLLLVEDDRMLAEAICDGVRQHAWQIDHAPDAGTAKSSLVEHNFSAILLDVGLPGASGLSVLKWMRERYDTTPVLVITARGQLSERIQGLDEGADDYLVKPFQLSELLARIRALTRRSRGQVVRELTCGDLRVEPGKRRIMKAGKPVILSAHEYRTLLALMERQGSIVTREHLQYVVYGNDPSIESNTIAVYIHQLRKKLGEGIIVTVHGHGYMIDKAAP